MSQPDVKELSFEGKCPYCLKENKLSMVYGCNGGSMTMANSQDYYDIGGKAHYHDFNTTTYDYTCSNNHAWSVKTRSASLCCDTVPALNEIIHHKGVLGMNTFGSITIGEPLTATQILKFRDTEPDSPKVYISGEGKLPDLPEGKDGRNQIVINHPKDHIYYYAGENGYQPIESLFNQVEVLEKKVKDKLMCDCCGKEMRTYCNSCDNDD